MKMRRLWRRQAVESEESAPVSAFAHVAVSTDCSGTSSTSTRHPQLAHIAHHDEQCYLAKRFHVCIQRHSKRGITKHLNLWFCSYNKYTQIAARAVRQSLKEEQRVAAEKRGTTALRYQHWEDGKGGEQVGFLST